MNFPWDQLFKIKASIMTLKNGERLPRVLNFKIVQALDIFGAFRTAERSANRLIRIDISIIALESIAAKI